MKTIQVGELKAHFSDVLQQLREGEDIIISYGRKRENVAVLVPYRKYQQHNRVTLGRLKGQASAEFSGDFKMSSSEMLEG